MESDGMDESRTVVVSGVPDLLPGHRMRDKLTVHFQSRRRSRGGDVEAVAYPTDVKGVAFVTFDQAADAETVVLKEQQTLADAAFSGEYALTVFPFTAEVLFYVSSARVDLTVFDGDQASLMRSLRAAHRSLRFQALPRERKATVEGPFSAVRALRQDLMSRARQLQPAGPAASVKLGDLAPNPGVTSHHGLVGPVSRSDSKAQREAEGSGGLSAPPRSAGEGRGGQGRLSNAKAPDGARRKEAPKDGPRLRPTPGHREEANVSLDPPPGESSNQPPVDGAKRTGRTPGQTPAQTRTLEVCEGRPRTGGPEDTCVWVDSYIFKYMERFDKQYRRCLRGLHASVEKAGGSDLVRISLAEEDPSEGPSRAQEAVVSLNALVEQCQLTLRVHEIPYDKKEHPKEDVMLICIDVETKYKHDDVFYMVEESKVTIVGPLSSSYRFYFTVKQRLDWAKL